MVYHDAGLEGDGPHAVVRHNGTGAWRCRPPVSVPGYLARKLPLPPPPPPTQPPPLSLMLQHQDQHQQQRAVGRGASALFGPEPAGVQRWRVTACHLVAADDDDEGGVGGGGRLRKYATVVREDRIGGPSVCGPRKLCMQSENAVGGGCGPSFVHT